MISLWQGINTTYLTKGYLKNLKKTFLFCNIVVAGSQNRKQLSTISLQQTVVSTSTAEKISMDVHT